MMFNQWKLKWSLPLIMLLMLAGNAFAAPPQTISYQAYLKDNLGLPVNATENVTFRLYNAEAAGTLLWSDTLSVTITDGLFSVELGSTSPLPKSSMDAPLWLGVEINNDGEAVPRKALNSVNNAFLAESVEVPLNLTGSSTDTMTVTNSSTSPSVTGVHGVISSTTPGGWSAALRGENKGTGPSGIGVYGSQDGSGWGVYGTATSGRGVYGQSTSGKAVYGTSTTGTAAYFSSSSGYGLIVQSGNVGVGILTPGSKLTVAGTVQSTTGGFKFPDGSIQTTASTGGGDLITHTADSSAHHARYSDAESVVAMGATGNTNALNHNRYSDAESVVAMLAADGAGSTLDADLIDGLEASELIDAATDEVRTPISSLPFTISIPGSYYLTGSLDGSAGGLTITTSDVQIDMMGFTVDGGGNSSYGINSTGSSNIKVVNGTVRGFGLTGVRLLGAGAIVVDVVSEGNGLDGIGVVSPNYAGFVLGDLARVIRCLASGNGSRGIEVEDGSIVKDSVISSNGKIGILIGSNSTVIDNQILGNGSFGIEKGTNETVAYISGNTVSNNGFVGISTGAGSTVISNTVTGSGGFGIIAGKSSTVTGNTVFDNAGGIVAQIGSTVINNTAHSNQDDGIRVESGSTVSNNTTYDNDGDGISASSNSTISNNTSYSNQQWGIFSSNSNTVRGNTINFNNLSQTVGMGGLRVNTDSLVVDNIASDNYETGIHINASDVVLRNNHADDSLAVGGVSQCFNFVSSDIAAIGNTATGCTTEFAGATVPASRFIDNIGW